MPVAVARDQRTFSGMEQRGTVRTAVVPAPRSGQPRDLGPAFHHYAPVLVAQAEVELGDGLPSVLRPTTSPDAVSTSPR